MLFNKFNLFIWFWIFFIIKIFFSFLINDFFLKFNLFLNFSIKYDLFILNLNLFNIDSKDSLYLILIFMKNFKFILEKVIIYYFLLKYNTLDFLLKNFLIKNLFIKFFLKKNFIIKFGLDISNSKLHLGHFSILKIIKNLKDVIKFIIIIGVRTAILIDPTYKFFTKKFNIKKINYMFFIKQFKIVFKNKKNIKLYFNNEWLNLFNNNNFLKFYKKLNIKRFLKRNDFKEKLSKNLKIKFSEIIYIIFQTEDSIFIKSNLELGGYDQKLNFLLTNYIKKIFSKNKQSIALFPLILIEKKKISKNKYCSSLNDNIFLFKKNKIEEIKKYLKFLINKEFIIINSNKIFQNYLIFNFSKFFYNFNFKNLISKKIKVKFKNLIKLKLLYFKFKYIKLNNIFFLNFNNLLFKNNYNLYKLDKLLNTF